MVSELTTEIDIIDLETVRIDKRDSSGLCVHGITLRLCGATKGYLLIGLARSVYVYRVRLLMEAGSRDSWWSFEPYSVPPYGNGPRPDLRRKVADCLHSDVLRVFSDVRWASFSTDFAWSSQ